MASLPMSSSFLGHTTATISTKHTKSDKKRVLKVNAFNKDEKIVTKIEVKKSRGRRELGFALMAIAAISSFGRVAIAEEPKAGTPEAKKKYAPICVTMPTARICHK
ncbi:photosystem II 5 kDa protein, chloroplastic-like [Lycium ferocissimum]|uniref:photosystem II 5 kDa protein, chloroplastic-like n=1 Tax=Lycium ferocissimum TaxID=112874 RepID=UPI0028168D66|nr:photosystem II 5 kDa protein, chloroplastic-like [Lycium ferocissimum]